MLRRRTGITGHLPATLHRTRGLPVATVVGDGHRLSDVATAHGVLRTEPGPAGEVAGIVRSAEM
ncbi:hypothetical protein RHODO2019_09190 [Rhodococcus antarcticus]|uniref:Uncharacterized protein n=1 Tax=Rhodococcus antarcticus TaxID=2987751 RepID=A0ABY6NVK0_9NOCA|nr:hypothetical protein [Rhodococcus antarcticus]UZJ23414.1 hypothetical protein RHODO2019_09190 [Rhodococcus antarcticus]